MDIIKKLLDSTYYAFYKPINWNEEYKHYVQKLENYNSNTRRSKCEAIKKFIAWLRSNETKASFVWNH